MISPISLAAFSTGGATSPLGKSSASTAIGSAGGVQRVRTQTASQSGTTQTPLKALPSTPDKTLPRGSLLNLQV